MKTKGEQRLKYYYFAIAASFIFITISFGILAFPKQDSKTTTVYYQNNLMANQNLKLNFISLNELFEKPTNNQVKSNEINSYQKKTVKKDDNVVLEKTEPQLLKNPVQEETPYISLEYGSNKSNEEANYIRKEYGDTIKTYANMYGLDDELVIAIASYSKKTSSLEEVDEQGNIGIMNIPFDAWYGQTVTAYNFDIDQEETIVLDEMLKTTEGNIQAGCAIFQNELKKYNYNILVGLQSYEYGGYYMEQVLSYYAKKVNKTYDQVLNSSDSGWLKYRSSLIQNGNSEYIEDVLKYYNGTGIIKVQKPDNTTIKINLNKQIDILSKIKDI